MLFGPDDAFPYDAKDVEKVLKKGDAAGLAVLKELREILAAADWTPESLTAALDGLAQSKGLGMGKVAQPLRVAVAGRTVSPSIHDTLELLGKDKTLRRIERCLTLFA